MLQNDLTYDKQATKQAGGYPLNTRWLVPENDLGSEARWQWSTKTVEILQGGKDSPLYYYSKRIIDVILATAMLIAFLPFFILLGILVKLDSSGPALFVQERVGARRRRSRDGQIVWEIQNFHFYKFRSMYVHADESLHEEHIKAYVNGTLEAADDGAKFKLKDDPRITRMGRILRKTSLDELPQLINVIKGEMSLVGPRPVPIYEVAEYDRPHYERLAAVPGITGLWQVKGRGETTFEEMIDMDVEYVRNASLFLDFKLLVLTFSAVLAGSGAE